MSEAISSADSTCDPPIALNRSNCSKLLTHRVSEQFLWSSSFIRSFVALVALIHSVQGLLAEYMHAIGFMYLSMQSWFFWYCSARLEL